MTLIRIDDLSDKRLNPYRSLKQTNETSRRGSEGHGLTDDVVAACDCNVTIPMQSGVDSLNVAVAAGIFLYSVLGTQY